MLNWESCKTEQTKIKQVVFTGPEEVAKNWAISRPSHLF